MSESEFELEKKLQRDLRRVDAPEGFADRLGERISGSVPASTWQPRTGQAQTSQPQTGQARTGRLVVIQRRKAWLAIAAVLLVGIVLGGWQWRVQALRERQQAEVARQQFEAAIEITGRTLVDVRERIGKVGEVRAGEVQTTGRKREVEQ